MTTLSVPKHILDWIDENRGNLSRQAFIIRCISKFKEVSDIARQTNKG